MEFENVFKIAECALGRDGHILENAIALSCGHYICKKCIPTNNFYEFRCYKCNEVNRNNLSLCKESDIIKFFLEKHMVGLSKLINEKIEIELDVFKSKC